MQSVASPRFRGLWSHRQRAVRYLAGMVDQSGATHKKPDAFVPSGFEPPASLAGEGFRLEPLGPDHNQRDHAAWMSSVEFIHTLPGFENSDWPSPMSLDENLADLEAHAKDFADRTGFTYSILDEDDVIGCIYIYPNVEPGHDAGITSWVSERRASMDPTVRKTIRQWIRDDWPFESPHIP